MAVPRLEETPLVLVVDDDEVFRNRLRRAFADRNWEADAAPDAVEALQFVRERIPDLVVVDLRMPGTSGLDLLEQLRASDSSMIIIMLTGYGSIPTAISAVKRGADHYLSKPVDADQILAVYENVRGALHTQLEIPNTVPSLARVEWEHMQRVITDCGGNISQAARLLGIHRRSLQRKLLKFPPAR
jgi:two-component system, response regulator RegA